MEDFQQINYERVLGGSSPRPRVYKSNEDIGIPRRIQQDATHNLKQTHYAHYRKRDGTKPSPAESIHPFVRHVFCNSEKSLSGVSTARIKTDLPWATRKICLDIVRWPSSQDWCLQLYTPTILLFPEVRADLSNWNAHSSSTTLFLDRVRRCSACSTGRRLQKRRAVRLRQKKPFICELKIYASVQLREIPTYVTL